MDRTRVLSRNGSQETLFTRNSSLFESLSEWGRTAGDGGCVDRSSSEPDRQPSSEISLDALWSALETAVERQRWGTAM